MTLDYRPSYSNENLGSKGPSSSGMVEPIFSGIGNFETLTSSDAVRRNDATGGLDAIDFPARPVD